MVLDLHDRDRTLHAQPSAGGRMVSNRRFLAVVAGALLIVGCGSAEVASPPVTVAEGTYMMTRLNGFALPANVSDDKSAVWINSGSLTIESSGSYTSDVDYTRLIGQTWMATTETCSGSYSRNPKGLVFSGPAACNGPTSATVHGRVLTRTGEPVNRGRVQDVNGYDRRLRGGGK